MTLPAWWLDSLSLARLRDELQERPERKLHLLTAAALRRVWDDLPSHHTQLAVQATEQFADRRITADQLARVRSTDLLESCDAIWLGTDASWDDEQLIGGVCIGCPSCDARAAEYECRVATSGDSFAGVRSGVREPAWIAVQALLRAREIAGWKATGDWREEAEREEGRAQFELLQELTAPHNAPRWTHWRTTDVRAVARGVYASRAFDQLPILADALQDAGCEDDAVLRHCREPGHHVRGCWVVDLAMGVA